MSTPAVSDTWERGSAYERYIGRWSRSVAPRFLAWLDTRDPGSLHPLQRQIREDLAFLRTTTPSARDRRHAQLVHLGTSAWAFLTGALLTILPGEDGLLGGMKLMAAAGVMGLMTYPLVMKRHPTPFPAMLGCVAWLWILRGVLPQDWKFWGALLPVAVDAVALTRLFRSFVRFEMHLQSRAQRRQSSRSKPRPG